MTLNSNWTRFIPSDLKLLFTYSFTGTHWYSGGQFKLENSLSAARETIKKLNDLLQPRNIQKQWQRDGQWGMVYVIKHWMCNFEIRWKYGRNCSMIFDCLIYLCSYILKRACNQKPRFKRFMHCEQEMQYFTQTQRITNMNTTDCTYSHQSLYCILLKVSIEYIYFLFWINMLC